MSNYLQLLPFIPHHLGGPLFRNKKRTPVITYLWQEQVLVGEEQAKPIILAKPKFLNAL